MRCPLCQRQLQFHKEAKYETGYEHVLDPNWEHEKTMRPIYKCDCYSSKFYLWNEEGELMTNRHVEGFHHDLLTYHRQKYGGFLEALDSIAFKVNQEVERKMKIVAEGRNASKGSYSI